ncbi:MAG: TonB family protein [Gammaproteobacteria bacterium]|jgi:TonB family protein|nr:TonB family protein [Gammaproteobacteria bacterium]MBT3489260.1 TonB family protein [Gammaproteobacteria bacterium]MBT3717798.1 TonB family protein [Gammaproteobacteria bacterium]MBT3843608.1 TonB family protein [Gammaproteobacteria bacterium]MBT3894044.1 TonB family protein [Gammaproteobacteria bacterium]
MVIRAQHWFFALVASMLFHLAIVWWLPIYQLETVKPREELPFTVLLADQDVLEQLTLKQPESLQSEEIPLVSLDETMQTIIDLSPSAIQPPPSDMPLDLFPVDMVDPLAPVAPTDLVMEVSAEVMAPQSQTVVTIVDSQPIELPSTVPLNLPQLLPDQLTKLEDIMEVTQHVTDMVLPIELAPVESELELEDEILPLEMDDQSEVVLAEIMIEQVAFDAMTFEGLPEITALDWSPQGGGLLSQSNATGKKPRYWRSAFPGAKGIDFQYRKKMRNKLAQFTLYPKAVAEKLGIEGRVLIGFTLNRSGELLETELIEGSGHQVLDEAVMQMIQFAQPFEVLPESVTNEKIKFAFPVTIKLKR